MIFEKVSIGQFESMKDGITKGLKDAVKNLAKSMVVNMTEETATEIANILYDNLANGELSAYETSIRAKMAQGVSKEDAVRQASLELGQRVTEAAASGALMGIGMGAGGSAVSYDKTNKIGSTIKANNAANAVIDLGKTMDQSSRSYVLAMELDGKETVTDAQLGELFLTIAEESQGKWNVDSAGDGVLDVPTQTSTKSDAELYNAAPMPDLSKFSDLDIRTDQLLMAQNPNVPSTVNTDTTVPTVTTPKSTPSQPNGGGGDLDAPQPTNAQSEYDRDLANVLEAATAGVEGRKPNLPQRPVKPLDPETARLNEIATAAIERREPNLPKAESLTPSSVDESGETEYNQRRRRSLARYEDLFKSAEVSEETSSLTEPVARPYTVFHEATIGETKSRSSHRRRANKELYARLESDSDFRKQMDDMLGYDVMTYMKTGKGALKNPSPDLVWHHPFDTGSIVELVYKSDHQNPIMQDIFHPSKKGGYWRFFSF